MQTGWCHQSSSYAYRLIEDPETGESNVIGMQVHMWSKSHIIGLHKCMATVLTWLTLFPYPKMAQIGILLKIDTAPPLRPGAIQYTGINFSSFETWSNTVYRDKLLACTKERQNIKSGPTCIYNTTSDYQSHTKSRSVVLARYVCNLNGFFVLLVLELKTNKSLQQQPWCNDIERDMQVRPSLTARGSAYVCEANCTCIDNVPPGLVC